MLGVRNCAYCGKPLDGEKDYSSRKYCDRSCQTKAGYMRKHPMPAHMRFDPELRAKALELYWGGLESGFIAKHLGVLEGTVGFWIYKFGRLRERQINKELFPLLPTTDRLQLTQNPEEWRQILCERAGKGKSAAVVLVCGTFDASGGINYLATLVSDMLKQNPCNGKTYAFCNNERTQISTVCWRRGTYCFTRLPKAHGSYIWPESSVGLQIEVRENEFEYLLGLCNKMGKKPYLT